LHRRRVGRSYALASKAVTVEQFQRFLKDRPDVPKDYWKEYSPQPECPINMVSWYMAAQYCNWLSEKEGIPQDQWCYPRHREIKEGMKPYPDYLGRTGYRLATEAEWEHACRAGSVSSRSYGSSVELLPRYAWYLLNSQGRTWPVGQKRPNDLGLFDMHGNVWTWVQDPTGSYPDGPGAIEDKEDRINNSNAGSRVLRGGSFNYLALYVRSAFRGGAGPGRNFYVGLRVARTYR
jgi:formylglycine-generating enzyme required for sulfatase activity